LIHVNARKIPPWISPTIRNATPAARFPASIGRRLLADIPSPCVRTVRPASATNPMDDRSGRQGSADSKPDIQ